MTATIQFAPLLPWAALIAGALIAVVLAAYSLRVGARGVWWRGATSIVLLLALANPSMVLEDRSPLKDIAVVLVDESASQAVGERTRQTQEALDEVRAAAERFDNLELRVVRGGRGSAASKDGTRLFEVLERALNDVPSDRLAGTIMITDGRVHDAPNAESSATLRGPLHVLLSGRRQASDRRIVIDQAPSYALVGQPQSITVRIEDMPAGASGQARVRVRRNGELVEEFIAPVGRAEEIPFELDRAGPTYFEIEVEAPPDDLSTTNNKSVVAVNGVRDRLRVLLISGEPHPGQRSWRNLLKSDPAVDLVHFTILRPPEKQDRTPVEELSLISFPVRELFDVRLDEFNLIIFDRYQRRGVILSRYIDNIARYVEEGGALLVATGPSFAGPLSLYRTPIGRILPGRPTGQMIETGFLPAVTELGERHPVTAQLPSSDDDDDRPWGRWFRVIEAETGGGQILMRGAEDRSLLVLDRIGEGRVAQLLSDQIWLWGRGFEGGGPQAELMRRVAHWLMKEPELEENDLRANVTGETIEVIRRSLTQDERPVTVTTPSGDSVPVPLERTAPGVSRGSVPVAEPGLYTASDGERTAMAAAGGLNSIETAEVRATAEILAPVVEDVGGSVTWLEESGAPELRRVQPDRTLAGAGRLGEAGWIGLLRNDAYRVTGIGQVPLLPALVVLLLILGGLAFAWRQEGK